MEKQNVIIHVEGTMIVPKIDLVIHDMKTCEKVDTSDLSIEEIRELLRGGHCYLGLGETIYGEPCGPLEEWLEMNVSEY